MSIYLKHNSHIWMLLSLLITFSSCAKKPIASADLDDMIIYPSPPAVTKIQYLCSFSSSKDFTGGQSAFKNFVFGEEEAMPIVKPYGISIQDSKIYICDAGIGGLEILNLRDNTFQYFLPKGRGQLQFPINCDVDERAYVYIADVKRKQIVIFDNELKYVNEISLGEEHKPTDLEVDEEYIYVSVLDNHAIYVYDKNSLALTKRIPESEDKGKDFLYQPGNIAVSDSIIYVSDVGDCKIKLFDKNANFLMAFGGSGRGFGQFTRPKGLYPDKEGNIYVVDAAFENIQIFNENGQLLLPFGGTYARAGGMWLPADVEIDYENLQYFEKYVSETFRLKYLIFNTNQYGPDKINVYGFVEPKN